MPASAQANPARGDRGQPLPVRGEADDMPLCGIMRRGADLRPAVVQRQFPPGLEVRPRTLAPARHDGARAPAPPARRSRHGKLTMITRWCSGVMGKRSKIRMQDSRAKISDSKIGNSEIKGRNSGLTRAGRRQQSRRCGGRRTCPSASLAGGAGTRRGIRAAASAAAARGLYDRHYARRSVDCWANPARGGVVWTRKAA